MERLRWYSRTDSRFVVLRNKHNVGLGETRNRGVAVARGEYLLFLDSDDWIRQDALERIYQSLDGKTPDLVMFDHYLAYDSGLTIVANQARFFRSHSCEPLGIVKRDLIRVFHVAWNKAYNRAFFTSHKFRYPVGYYEDFVVTYKAIIVATDIQYCMQPLYYYQQRAGTHPNRPNKKSANIDHMQIFERYNDLYLFLTTNSVDLYKDIIYTKMINQFTAILCERLAYDKSRQTEFFTTMREHANLYKPEKLHYFSLKDKVLYWCVCADQKKLLILLNKIYRIYTTVKYALPTRHSNNEPLGKGR